MLRKLLFPFSLLYGLIIFVRNKWYTIRAEKSFKADIPTISIGNLTTGGTGKTPMAEYLLGYTLAKGLRPAYLSRGYGRKTNGYILVNTEEHSAEIVGDEALQVAVKFPQAVVAVCESRSFGIKTLTNQFEIDVLILDDAFQHRKVGRDLDLIMIDANRPPWKDLLLPAGNLREPMQSLNRSTGIIVNKVRDEKGIHDLSKPLIQFGKPLAFTQPIMGQLQHFFSKASLPPAQLKDLEVIAFSGIGNPHHFQQQLIVAGCTIKEAVIFRDHYTYREQDIRQIEKSFLLHFKNSPKFASQLILTTEKDFFRLRNMPWLQAYASLPIYYVPIGLHWMEGEEKIISLFEQCLLHEVQ